MDKYEYKVRSEEIKELIARREYAQAAEIADTIDWRRVKSVKMLCTVSDLYKINRRYDDSRDMLLLAYDHHPSGRTIVYALCELAVKMGELPQAVEYCKEFVQIAPKDPGRYILQYKIYEAQEVSLEERIAVLEELKKRDYREKWAYELAYLYHRIGLASKCVDECDEMIVWFGDGKYVIKAMELKMLHQPLSEEQQRKYDNRFAPQVEEVVAEEPAEAPEAEAVQEEAQEAVAETVVWSAQEVQGTSAPEVMDAATRRMPVEDIDIQVKTMDPGQCNTINLQEEVAAGLRELWEGKAEEEVPVVTETMQETEEETKVIPIVTHEELQEEIAEAEETVQVPEAVEESVTVAETVVLEALEAGENVQEEVAEAVETVQETIEEAVSSETETTTAEQVMEQLRQEKAVEPLKEMAKVLSMESDGQISFIMPEREAVEKQITGQISIEDIMAEWERMKKALEEKGKEKVRQHVKENTGQMFTEFEASVRDGLLEQLENGEDIETIMAAAEGRTLPEEEDIPVPPSLQEEEVPEESTEEQEANATAEWQEEADWQSVTGEEETVSEAETVEETIEDAAPDEEVISPEDEVEELVEIEPVPEIDELTEDNVDAAYEAALINAIGTAPVQEEAVEEEQEETEGSEVAETAEEEVVEPETVSTEEVAEEATDAVPEEPVETTEEAVFETIEEVSDTVAEEVEQADEEIGEEQLVDMEAEQEEESAQVRSLSKEEKELFGPYIQGRSSKEQLLRALDNISMAAYTGNVIITGSEGLDTLGLAKSIIRDVQIMDSNFSGKTAKISGAALNKRDVNKVMEGLVNGALIIQKATDLDAKAVDALYRALQQEHTGMVVVLEGTKKAMNAFLEENAQLQSCFTSRIDMEALSDAALVAFCKKYAREMECSIDELGVLELHRIITERQTNDHAVTLMEVKEIMDDAIESANRKTIGHFLDIVTGKRYDEEDMIIIREKDFW